MSRADGNTTRQPPESPWTLQTQPGDAYRLPLELGVADGKIEKIEMTQKQQRFEIAVDQEPSSVLLDPNTWTLIDARFAKR